MVVDDWGPLSYKRAWQRQRRQVEQRRGGQVADRLIFVEHPAVITLGRQTSSRDLFLSESVFRDKGIELFQTDRGGKATFHGPGQLVAYPIILLEDKDLHRYVDKLLGSVAAVLYDYGLEPEWKKGEPGIWVQGRKIASIGIAVKKWITYHGIALNVNTDLSAFAWFAPCGKSTEVVTSMERELGRRIPLVQVKETFIEQFCRRFGYAADVGEE